VISNNGTHGLWRLSAPGEACDERSGIAAASKAEVVGEDFVRLSLSEWGGGVRRSGDQCYCVAELGRGMQQPGAHEWPTRPQRARIDTGQQAGQEDWGRDMWVVDGWAKPRMGYG
jgi:hypothetical protein